MSEKDSFALNRRDFLTASGFLLAGCTRMPAEKAIPFLVQPEEIVPGQAYWYASTCAGCEARCGALVKCRDGRPIKLEGNPDHAVSRGGLCAVGQATVLGLYDSLRLQKPLLAGKPATWAEVDVVALYETVAEEPDEHAIDAAKAADYVTFSSASTVRNLKAALGGNDLWRLRFMRLVTFHFLADVFRQTLRNLRHDGALWRWRTWQSGWRFLLGRDGLLRQVRRPWRDYFRADFHPREQDTDPGDRWLRDNAQAFAVVPR